MKISVVIIAKNEERIIGKCIDACKDIADEILVLENGSTDQTADIVCQKGVRMIEVEWLGYSKTKNKGNEWATYDWILSLDADEIIDTELSRSIGELKNKAVPENRAFSLKRKLIFQGKILHFGSAGNEKHIRLFHKEHFRWNASEVHETLERIGTGSGTEQLKGTLLHDSAEDLHIYREKLLYYARLYRKNHRRNVLKCIANPLFYFMKNYIFRLGFLDGKAGYTFAGLQMSYIRKKYCGAE